MTDPTTELTALHTLAKSCPGGVEMCAWWGMGNTLWCSRDNNQWHYCSETISPQHALDLVVAHAERWLLSQPDRWQISRVGSRVYYDTIERLGEMEFTDLHAALAYAMAHA